MNKRDPQRIRRMIELLRQAWERCPDYLLTQLIMNAADTKQQCGQIFFFEDTEMELKLQALVQARRRYLSEHTDHA